MTGASFFPVGGTDADEELQSTDQQWKGTAGVLGPKWAKMPLSTIGLLGLQIVWSVEMGYASPYLLTLGLPKAHVSMVFLAGPLSGLVVQPLVGAFADRSTSRFGRRRPYIIVGSLICGASIMLLGFTRGFAGLFTKIPSNANDVLTVALAILSIFFIDFSINAVQAADRTLIVDVWPRSEQERGNAWAARMTSLGSVLGFFVGNVDLTDLFPFLGKTQLEIYCSLSVFLLLVTHCTTAYFVKEKVLLPSQDRRLKRENPLRQIWRDLVTLPRVIRYICIIQFFAWVAWFPILFFASVYVGELYKQTVVPTLPASWTAQMIEDEANRLASRALFYSSVVSLVATIGLPWCVDDDADSRVGRRGGKWSAAGTKSKWVRKLTLAEVWTISQGLFALSMAATFFVSSVTGASIMVTLTGVSWAVTMWVPTSLIGQTIHTESNRGDPADDEDIALSDRRTTGNGAAYHSLPADAGDRERLLDHGSSNADGKDEGDESDEEDTGRRDTAGVLGSNPLARQSHADVSPLANGFRSLEGQNAADTEGEGEGYSTRGNGVVRKANNIGDKAGSILGIHNIFVVVPQFIVSGLSSIIFALYEPASSTPLSDNLDMTMSAVNSTSSSTLESAADAASRDNNPAALSLVFKIGGVSSLIACILCYRLAQELKR